MTNVPANDKVLTMTTDILSTFQRLKDTIHALAKLLEDKFYRCPERRPQNCRLSVSSVPVTECFVYLEAKDGGYGAVHFEVFVSWVLDGNRVSGAKFLGRDRPLDLSEVAPAVLGLLGKAGTQNVLSELISVSERLLRCLQ